MQWLNCYRSLSLSQRYASSSFSIAAAAVVIATVLLQYLHGYIGVFFYFITNDFRCFVWITCDFQCSVQFKRYRRCRVSKFYASLEHFFSLVSTGTQARCARNNGNKKRFSDALKKKQRREKGRVEKTSAKKCKWMNFQRLLFILHGCVFFLSPHFLLYSFCNLFIAFFVVPGWPFSWIMICWISTCLFKCKCVFILRLQLFCSGLIKWPEEEEVEQRIEIFILKWKTFRTIKCIA